VLTNNIVKKNGKIMIDGKEFTAVHKIHLNLVKEDNSDEIKMGTFITDEGLKQPKTISMMFKSLEKIFIEHIKKQGWV